MENRSESGLAFVVVGVLLAAVLLGAVGGFFFLRSRTRMEVQRQSELAQAVAMQEQVARMRQQLAAETVERELQSSDVAAKEERPKGVPVAAGDAAEQRASVTALLERQQAAWNQGDLTAFMEPYWKSEQLTFSSGGKVRRGWEATMQRYRENYPTPEKMGKLTLSGVEVTSLGETAALVLGEWKLERAEEPVGGNFSLVVRKTDGQWVIVHDHTSRAAE